MKLYDNVFDQASMDIPGFFILLQTLTFFKIQGLKTKLDLFDVSSHPGCLVFGKCTMDLTSEFINK